MHDTAQAIARYTLRGVALLMNWVVTKNCIFIEISKRQGSPASSVIVQEGAHYAYVLQECQSKDRPLIYLLICLAGTGNEKLHTLRLLSHE